MCKIFILKFTFSENATKIEKIFTVNLTICSNHQIDDEDFVNFCGLLRKPELYVINEYDGINPMISDDIINFQKEGIQVWMN